MLKHCTQHPNNQVSPLQINTMYTPVIKLTLQLNITISKRNPGKPAYKNAGFSSHLSLLVHQPSVTPTNQHGWKILPHFWPWYQGNPFNKPTWCNHCYPGLSLHQTTLGARSSLRGAVSGSNLEGGGHQEITGARFMVNPGGFRLKWGTHKMGSL